MLVQLLMAVRLLTGGRTQVLDAEFFQQNASLAGHAFVNGKAFSRSKQFPHQNSVTNDGTPVGPRQARIASVLANQDGGGNKHHKKMKRVKQRSGRGMIRGSHMTIASGIRVCGVEIDLYLYYHLLSLFSPLLTMLGTVSIQQPLKPSLSICHGAGQSSSRRSRPSMSNICAKLVTVKKGRKEGILSPLLPISILLHVFFISDSVESKQTCNHRQKSGLLVRWQLRRSDSFLIRPQHLRCYRRFGVRCSLQAFRVRVLVLLHHPLHQLVS